MIFGLFGRKQHGKETLVNPQYRIYAKADNGFTLAYQAHFALDGETIEFQRGKTHTTDIYIEQKYEHFFPESYYFDVKAEGEDPAAWEYRQRNSENPYDRAKLIELMGKLDFESKGHVNLTITEFDGYQITELKKLEQETHGTLLWQNFALFKDGKRLTIPGNLNLGCLHDFYRRKD
ncbi:MAG: hypothetical protein J5649_10535 [Lachnospiraceae bacterium]|nr:hypothetical protein [Lachnospiraceae bacterium]